MAFLVKYSFGNRVLYQDELRIFGVDSPGGERDATTLMSHTGQHLLSHRPGGHAQDADRLCLLDPKRHLYKDFRNK